MTGRLKTEPPPAGGRLFCGCGKRLEYDTQCDWYVCPDCGVGVPAETLHRKYQMVLIADEIVPGLREGVGPVWAQLVDDEDGELMLVFQDASSPPPPPPNAE